MVLPPETLNCFDLPPIRAGWIALRPLTLGDVAVLARAGIDVLAPMGPGDAEAVFALLSQPAALPRGRAPFRLTLAARLFSSHRQRMEAVARALDVAFRNAVPGKTTDGERTDYLPTGYGWPLEAAERLMHEYGMGFDEAAAMPLVRVYSLFACARVRGGGKANGPDYFERWSVTTIKGGSR